MPKKVRILSEVCLEGAVYAPNQVVQFSDAAAKSLVGAGAADDDKAAVAYAMSLPGAEVVIHPAEQALAKEPAPAA